MGPHSAPFRSISETNPALSSKTSLRMGMSGTGRTYFIRRYRKGVARSGTEDVFISNEPIAVSDLVRIAHSTGPGKYLLGERGKGIRGFRKITDCLVPEEDDVADALSVLRDPTPSDQEPQSPITDPIMSHTTFEAETISVRRALKLAEMENGDLMDVFHSMVRTPLEGGEEYDRFRSDLQSLHAEMERRGFAHPPIQAAEGTVSKNAEHVSSRGRSIMGVSMSPVMAGTIGVGLGALVGWLATDRHYKQKLDGLNIRIGELESNIKEAERSIRKAEDRMEKAAESATPAATTPFDARKALNEHFLSEFNFKNGPQY